MSYADDIPADLARAAHGGTSFTPDKRADQERASYAATMAADLASLERYATTDEKRALLADEFARYRAGYAARVRAYLGARSRCMSSMITGPSRFPTARNAKRNATADKRCQEMLDYREGALAAITRKLRPELAPIMAGDDDAAARLRQKLAKAEERQAGMKAANAAIRKAAKGGAAAQVAALVALGYPETIARELLTPDSLGRVGFADYEIKNNGAQIRQIAARLASVTAAKATPDTTTRGEHATIEESAADNRIRLTFPGKPAADVRARLKAGGFRWAPTINAWQAYINNGTRALARAIAGAPPTAIDAAATFTSEGAAS